MAGAPVGAIDSAAAGVAVCAWVSAADVEAEEAHRPALLSANRTSKLWAHQCAEPPEYQWAQLWAQLWAQPWAQLWAQPSVYVAAAVDVEAEESFLVVPGRWRGSSRRHQ